MTSNYIRVLNDSYLIDGDYSTYDVSHTWPLRKLQDQLHLEEHHQYHI